MNIMKRRRMQIPLIAVAALAMFAMAAALLLAGDAQAHATTTTIAADGGDNTIPQQQGQSATATPTPAPHKTPEACPGEEGNPNTTAARVVDSGQIALFDVYWNPVEKELTNNICPPSVVHVPADPGDEDEERPATPARDDRSASSINITAEPPTIIHVPSSAMVDLNTSTEYTEARYPEVWKNDKRENRPNAQGTPVRGKGDGKVWVLPACPTDGSTFSGLCLSFSAALLNPEDWKEGTKIRYSLDHVHQIDTNVQEPRYTLAYDHAADAVPPFTAVWDTGHGSPDKIKVNPGGYERPVWIFTDRGTYELQVHIRGYPKTTLANPTSDDTSVTSDQRKYIIHVGAEADLGATMTVQPALAEGDTTLDPGDNVTITVTAGNAGPDEAEETYVDVTLPDGLTYSSHEPTTANYNSGTGVWNIGAMPKDASKTLTITATVDAETHGQDLTVDATVYATEAVKITGIRTDTRRQPVRDDQGNVVREEKTYHVAVPDPDPDNNTAMGTTTVASLRNADPMFLVARSVPENSSMGTNVGTPVLVKNPESDDTLTFILSGNGHRNFTVETVDSGAQLKVAEGSYLNHEDTSATFDLTLQVSDGTDTAGNHDNNRVDDTIEVRIAVDDVSEAVGITLTAPSTATVGQEITLEASLGSSPPVPRGEMDFVWVRRSPNGEIDWRDDEHGSDEDLDVTYGSAGVKQYAVFAKYFDRSALVVKTVESAWVNVTWTNPSPE